MSRSLLPTLLIAIVCAPGWAALLTENLFGALHPLRELGLVPRPLDELL